jgi:hypothetical protein
MSGYHILVVGFTFEIEKNECAETIKSIKVDR